MRRLSVSELPRDTSALLKRDFGKLRVMVIVYKRYDVSHSLLFEQHLQNLIDGMSEWQSFCHLGGRWGMTPQGVLRIVRKAQGARSHATVPNDTNPSKIVQSRGSGKVH